MNSSGFYATAFRITTYFFKIKKRFGLAPRPLLLIHHIGDNAFDFIS